MSVHDETFDYNKAIKAIQTPKAENELKTLVKRLFEILDTKEESDSEREFSPVFISCCRAHLNEELNKILPKIKELAND